MATRLNTDRQAVKRRLEGNRIIYCCPKCGKPLKIEGKYKKNLCMRCGQYLDWKPMAAQWWVEWLICQDRSEAMLCAEKYNEYSKTSFFDPESFLEKGHPGNRNWPKEMYFAFTDAKAYGRFMRWVAKDGPTRLIMPAGI